MTRKLTAVSAAISVIACLAACSATAGAVTDDPMPEYRCRFARNAWKADDWIIGAGGNPFHHWWVFIPATLALILFSIGWNLLGDGLNTALNPRSRGRT